MCVCVCVLLHLKKKVMMYSMCICASVCVFHSVFVCVCVCVCETLLLDFKCATLIYTNQLVSSNLTNPGNTTVVLFVYLCVFVTV